MKRVLWFFVTILLCTSMFAACGKAEGMVFPNYIPDNTPSYYSGTAFNDSFLCCNMTGSKFTIFNGESIQSQFSYITSIEASEHKSVYRSALCVVNDGTNFYSVEVTVNQDASTDSFKFKSAELRRLDIEKQDSQSIAEIDISPAITETTDVNHEACMRFINAALSQNHLYLVFETPFQSSGIYFADDAELEHFLLRYELGNPTPQRFELAGGAELVAAEGDLVMYSALSADSNDVQICVLDTSTGNRSVLQTISGKNGRAGHFAYDTANAKLYYNLSSQIYEMDASGSSTLVAALPFQDVQGLQLLSGNRIVGWSSSSVAVRDIDPNAANNITKLTVFGLNRDLSERFSEAYPLISIAEADSSTDLVNTVLTQSPTPDVIIMNTLGDPAFIDLMRRGYLLPLDSEMVKDTMSKFYPEIADFVTHEGKIVALPFEHIAQPMYGVNRALWNELNLGELPQTWEDFLALIQRWPEIQKEHPSAVLFSDGYTTARNRGMVLNMMLEDYERYRQGEDGMVGYDTEIFRNLLKQFQAVDFNAALDGQLASADQELITMHYYPDARDSMSDFDPLPLRVAKDAPTYMRITMTAIAINPYSKNIDAAKQLVDFYAQNIAPLERVELMPGENDPIRKENYEEELAYRRQCLEEAQQQLAACENEVDRQPLEEHVKLMQQLVTDCENSWDADEASIAKYRAVAQHIYVQYIDSLDLTDSGAIYQSMERYLNGELPEASFIGDLERRYVMRTQEGAQ